MELGREKEHIRKALQVNAYLHWMLEDSWMSDQSYSGQEEEEDVKEGEDEKNEVEQRLPTTSKAFEGPRVPVTKTNYPVVLQYVSGISEQLRRVFKSFDILAYFKPTNTLATTGMAQG